MYLLSAVYFSIIFLKIFEKEIISQLSFKREKKKSTNLK